MDYSELSDFEINKLVDIAFHGETTPMRTQSLDFGVTNYCLNADQAWPIIINSLIALKPVPLYVGGHRWFATNGEGDFSIKYADENPLRAAMIVYLMMQESANVPANPARSDIR
ncbi:phage protein NinX family protein [Citrobacter freundii]|uniref:phage protein NinX family protein n=1 Tax=Citrobacter freundii TaxID=546 RepID=UPI00110D4F4A|nr:phage protein NinX family protein [Citrobacter freundii]EKU3951864.1 DUF2591 family protein [Citrobacter freundii]QCW55976.1 DUF2591 domain-containing protein [Citrobacter freundii]